MALLANCHRDPKASKPFTPADFMPMSTPTAPAKPGPSAMPADIGVLKMFLRGTAAQPPRERPSP
jgi:hypothetical protein